MNEENASADDISSTIEDSDGCIECKLRWKSSGKLPDITESTNAKYTFCDVNLHSSMESCWLVAFNTVYDVTSFLVEHPGGVRSILRNCGKICDRDFNFHSNTAQVMWKKYQIGKLVPCPGHPNVGQVESGCIIS